MPKIPKKIYLNCQDWDDPVGEILWDDEPIDDHDPEYTRTPCGQVEFAYIRDIETGEWVKHTQGPEIASKFIFKRIDKTIKTLKWSRLNWLMIGVMFGAVFATIIFHTILFIPPEYTWGGLLP